MGCPDSGKEQTVRKRERETEKLKVYCFIIAAWLGLVELVFCNFDATLLQNIAMSSLQVTILLEQSQVKCLIWVHRSNICSNRSWLPALSLKPLSWAIFLLEDKISPTKQENLFLSSTWLMLRMLQMENLLLLNLSPDVALAYMM